MTIAKAVMAAGQKPEKTIVFAAWSGEEKGLLGSNYFVQNPYKENIIVNLNYDMIARNSQQDTLGNQCGMSFTSAYPVLQEMTEKHNEEFDIGLEIRFRGSERPRGGSDHAPFAAVDIPIFYFMAAMHPDYHQPSDEVSKVNWEKMRKIIQLGFLNVWEISQNGLKMQEE
jgi:Zn-dependent M28 family amino/carboxypeptidase